MSYQGNICLLDADGPRVLGRRLELEDHCGSVRR